MNEQKFLTELHLALLGEPCLFTTTKVSGLKFRINEDILKDLPLEMSLIMEKIAELSSYVRIIEELLNKGRTVAELRLDESIEYQNDPLPTDAIKKAIVESILTDYHVYLTSADAMRIEHICEKKKHSIQHVINFALGWHKRLRFVQSLIPPIAAFNGMQLMNIFFQKWTSTFCTKDWEHSLLEHALLGGSKVLSAICNSWLLDGHLDDETTWMIQLEKKIKSTNRPSSKCSLNNSSNSSFQFEIPKPKDENTKVQVLEPNEEVFIIDKELVPAIIADCKELLELILDIGQQICLLKALRRTRAYEHEVEVRRQILLDALKPDIWYNSSQRGHLHIALHKLSTIVREDTICELLERQRLVDHLALVHAYFFTLRGDLFAALEQIIQVQFVKPTGAHYYQTPKSLRKRRLDPKIPEHLMADALSKCAPPSCIADLMSMLTSDKSSRTSSRSFFESFGLIFDITGKKRGKTDLPSQMNPFFSRNVLRIYKSIFKLSANLQMLRFQLDEISHRFTHNTCPKLRHGKASQSLIFYIHSNLLFLRHFLSRLASYMFEHVLLLESNAILRKVQREMNPHCLLQGHQKLLGNITRALFLNSNGAMMNQSLVNTIRDGRSLVNAVEDFCEAIDKTRRWEHGQIPLLELNKDNSVSVSTPTRNADLEIVVGKLADGETSRSSELVKLENQQLMLQGCATQFKKSHSQLPKAIDHYICDRTRTQSPYWHKLQSMLCEL